MLGHWGGVKLYHLHLHESCGHRLQADREANDVAVGFTYKGRAITVTGVVAAMVSKDRGAASPGLTTEGSAGGVSRHFAEERALEFAKCREGGPGESAWSEGRKGAASLTIPSELGARWSDITAVLRRPAGFDSDYVASNYVTGGVQCSQVADSGGGQAAPHTLSPMPSAAAVTRRNHPNRRQRGLPHGYADPAPTPPPVVMGMTVKSGGSSRTPGSRRRIRRRTPESWCRSPTGAGVPASP